jgi:DNA modification methylase
MQAVGTECRRVLKPKGSAVFILQPNSEKIGKMRLWLWDFVVWAGREWNLVQDAWWWKTDGMPLAGATRKHGLMRPSVKMCVWLGPANCYRNQDAVLQTPSLSGFVRSRADQLLRINPSNRTYRNSTFRRALDERGGSTPFNCLPIPTGGNPGGAELHPAVTPYQVAEWWAKYILPPGGVLLDPFCGSGTMLQAGLDCGASRVIGIDREKKYLAIAKGRIAKG